MSENPMLEHIDSSTASVTLYAADNKTAILNQQLCLDAPTRKRNCAAT